MGNNIILGSIPASGGGMKKTYEESIIFFAVREGFVWRILNTNGKREKIYVNQKCELIAENDISTNIDPNKLREVEILNIYPYKCDSNGYAYMIEVIDKEILHEHLESDYELKRKLSR